MKPDKNAVEEFVGSLKVDFANSTGRGLIFRGEPEKYEMVRSSLLRSFDEVSRTSGVDAPFCARQSDSITAEEASPYFGGGIIEGAEFEALAILQHFGAPTSLIDFSADWRVALYFACEKASKEAGRIVFFTEEAAKYGYGLTVRRPQGHQHDPSGRPVGREIEQASVLVWKQSGEFSPCSTDTRLVERENKAGLLAWLRAQGIHRESVYRDAHGFVTLMGENRHWQAIHVAESAIELGEFKVARKMLAHLIRKHKSLGIEQKGKALHLLGRAHECQEKHEKALRAYRKSCSYLLHRENGTAPRLGIFRCSTELGRKDLADSAVESIDWLW